MAARSLRSTRTVRIALAAACCAALLVALGACTGDTDPKKKAAAESTVPMTTAPAVVAPPATGVATTSTTSVPSASSAVDTAWRAVANDLDKREGETATFDCPAGGFVLTGQLWGSTYYTDDSRICPAAVHEGVITAANGGMVTIRFEAGRPSYEGSTRNGVTSDPYGEWSSTFVFVK